MLISLLPLALPSARNLEYEYLFLLGLAASILTPWLALTTPWLSLRHAHLIQLGLIAPLFMLPVGLMMFASGLCRCSTQDFLFWFAIQAYPAWWVGLGLAKLSCVIDSRSSKRRTALFSLLFIQITFLLGAAFILWFFPQKRLSHIMLGFIHGPIYDHWIPVDGGIVWSRFSHAVCGGLLFWASQLWQKGQRQRGLAAIAVGFCLLLSTFFQSSTSHGHGALKKLLPLSKSHPHFNLYYRNEADKKDYEQSIENLFDEARFHIEELRALFGGDPPRVDIYVYPDRDLKKLWFGGGGTDITDVVGPSIHIVAQIRSHPTLRHELVHAIASDIAFHGLGFHPNMALTEGLAVALGPTQSPRSLDEATAAMLHQGRLPNFSELGGPLFWTQSGARAYTAAGSLIRYLIQEYGMEPVRQLYAGHQPESIGETSWPEIIEAWQNDLLSRYPKRQDLAAEALFRYPGVLRDLYPHSKALLAQKGDSFWTRLRQPTDWKVSRNYWPWRIMLDSSDKAALTSYLRQKAKSAVSEGKVKDIAEVLSEVADAVKWPPTSIEDLELKLLEFDLARFLQRDVALEALAQLVEQASEDLIGPALTRQVWSRQLIWTEKDLDKKEQSQWLDYLAGWQSLPDLPAGGLDSPWIVLYLQNFRGKGPDAAELLRHQLSPSIKERLAPSFAEMWYLNLYYRLAEDKDWANAKLSLQRALKFSHEGSRGKLSEMIRFMTFRLAEPQS